MSAKGINRRGSAPRLRRFLEIALNHGPVNFGDMRTGNGLTTNHREILRRIREDSLLNVVFASKESLFGFLAALKEADLGLSIVVSGLMDEACRCARREGFVPHTLAFSLGVWGRKEKLAEKGILAITTMCGHGLVAPGLVRLMAGKVADGGMSAEEAASELAKPCVCGAFNPVRAAALLRRGFRDHAAGRRPDPSRGGGGSFPIRSKRAAGVRS